MSRVIALTQEKGGSGKTTAAVEIAYHAGSSGKSVLVVDLDPQGNATSMLLGDEDVSPNVFDLFVDSRPLSDVIRPAIEAWPNVLVVPSSPRLSTVDGHLGHRSGKDRILRRLLQPVRDVLDLILIDLGPAADYLTVNALVAADRYHVPADLSEYTLSGLQTIRDLANDVKESGANPELVFGGVHFSGYHKGGSYGVRGLEEKLKQTLGIDVIDIKVPHSSKVIESQRLRRPVGSLDPDGKVSLAYKTLTERILSYGA